MNSIHTAYSADQVFDQLSEEEKVHVHSFNIAEIIKSLALEHPKTLELVLALAGPDVALQIETIYSKFLDEENLSVDPIKIGNNVLKTIGKVDLAINALHGDEVADETPLDDFKNLIVKKW